MTMLNIEAVNHVGIRIADRSTITDNKKTRESTDHGQHN